MTAKVTEHNVVRQDIMDALYACIEKSPAKEQAALAQALEAYALRYSRTYKGLQNGAPFLQDIMGTMEEASDARVNPDRVDVDDIGYPVR